MMAALGRYNVVCNNAIPCMCKVLKPKPVLFLEILQVLLWSSLSQSSSVWESINSSSKPHVLYILSNTRLHSPWSTAITFSHYSPSLQSTTVHQPVKGILTAGMCLYISHFTFHFSLAITSSFISAHKHNNQLTSSNNKK